MVSEFKKRQTHDFFRDITSIGSLWFYVTAVAFFIAIRQISMGIELAFGLAMIYLIVVIVRTIYFKERPTKYPYNSYLERLDASSFPSLHAARIIFLGAVLMHEFQDVSFSIFSIFVMTIVSYSRIKLKKHDNFDVFAGWIVGVIVFFLARIIF